MESRLWLITILYINFFSLRLFYLQSLHFILSRRMIGFVFLNVYSWNKMKNEFTVSFKIKTTISHWYASIKEVFAVSLGMINLWEVYSRSFVQPISSVRADMDISSIALKRAKEIKIRFLSPVEFHLWESKQEQESLPQQCINEEVASELLFSLWLVEYSVTLIPSYVCLSA